MDPEPPIPHFSISVIILLSSVFWNVSIAFCFLIVLIICSALISGSEVAYFSLSPSNLKDLKEEETKVSNRIVDLYNSPKELLATILIFNNLVNIAIVIVSFFIFDKLLSEDLLARWSFAINDVLGMELSWLPTAIEFLCTTLVATFILVLFGEVTPKIYANVNNIKFATFMSRPLSFLTVFSRPLSRPLVTMTSYIENKVDRYQGTTDKEEIDRAIELAMNAEENADDNVDILKGIIKFGDVTVKQIMKSRVDVMALEISTPFNDLMDAVKASGYSRIPIFVDDFDSIAGLLYVKDLLGYLGEKESFDWQKLIKENVLYVPESKKINELLKEFQKQRIHMAIVVDEYGGSSGIVTLEDVLEEVIGDIKDEFDQEEFEYIKLDDSNYIFEGKTMINDVCRVIGTPIESFDEVKGDADSLAGILLELYGKIPKEGQIISHDKYTFRILDATKRRIERIKLTID